MKRFIKHIAFSVAAVMMLGTVACNTQTEDTSVKPNESSVQSEEPDGETETGEPIKLVIWGGVPAENGPQDVVDLWNSNNPDVQVEYVRFVNDDSGNVKLDTALVSGEKIDLFFTYNVDNMTKRANSGIMENLENFQAMDFVKAELFGEGETGLTTVNDTLYAMPTNSEPYGILYNKNMLDEANITIPENWTLDEFREITEKLTKEENGKRIYGANIIDEGNPIRIQRSVLGDNQFYKSETESSFDNPIWDLNLVFKEMMDDQIVMPYEEIFSRDLSVYAHPAFLNEEFAMFPGSIWHFRYINDLETFPHDFQVGFAPYPRPDAETENPYQSILGNWLSINSNSEHKEEAWEFLKFWVTDGSMKMLRGGKMPAWKNADQEAVIAGLLGENADQLYYVENFKEVFLNPELKYIVDSITVGLPEIAQIYKEENQNLFLGATAPEEYREILKTRADSAIASAK